LFGHEQLPHKIELIATQRDISHYQTNAAMMPLSHPAHPVNLAPDAPANRCKMAGN
jgi:hypothetical protein